MIPVTLIVLIIVFNSQMDVIQFHPQNAWFSGWWIEKKQLHKSFWKGTVFNMFSDGWHFCKFLMRICEITLFYFCLGLNMNYMLAGLFILIMYGNSRFREPLMILIINKVLIRGKYE